MNRHRAVHEWAPGRRHAPSNLVEEVVHVKNLVIGAVAATLIACAVLGFASDALAGSCPQRPHTPTGLKVSNPKQSSVSLQWMQTIKFDEKEWYYILVADADHNVLFSPDQDVTGSYSLENVNNTVPPGAPFVLPIKMSPGVETCFAVVATTDLADPTCNSASHSNWACTIGPPAPPPPTPPPPPPPPATLLKVTKSAPGETPGNPGTCLLTGPCTFTVVVQNTGTNTFAGGLFLDDKFNAVMSSISSTQTGDPWACIDEPNTQLTGCIESSLVLPPGASTGFQISGTPGPGVQLGDVLQNCLSIDPGTNAQFGSAGLPIVDPTSQLCGTAKLEPPFAAFGGVKGRFGIQPTQLLPKAIAPPACPPGTIGTYPNCQAITTTQEITVPTSTPQTPATLPTPTPAACFSNMVTDGNGGCACPSGTSWNGAQCVPPAVPAAPSVQQPLPQVQGPPAGTATGGPSSAFPGVQAPVARPCPAGTLGRFPICRRIPGPGTGGLNGISPGETPPPTQLTPSCPPGTFGHYPVCRRLRGIGTVGTNGPSQGTPTPPQFTPSCPPGTFGNYPVCRRLRGTTNGPQGSPTTPPTTVERHCPPGTFGHYPICRRLRGTGTNTTTIPNTGNGGTNGVSPPASQTTQPTTTAPHCRPGTVGHYPFCRRRFPSTGSTSSTPATTPTTNPEDPSLEVK